MLARAFDALPRAVIVTTPDEEILLWNKTAETLYGWSADEVVGRKVSEVLVPVSERTRAAEIVGAVRAGETWAGDFTVLRRDGSPVRVWVIDRPIRDDTGEVIAVLGASEDVAELRKVEQRNADLTEHLQLALDAGGLGTFRWDLGTGLVEWDAKLEALFGLEPDTFPGTFDAFMALVHPEDREHVRRTLDDAVRTKSRYDVEHRVLWPDGSTRWLHGSGQVTLDERGEVTGTIGAAADTTERTLAEAERQRLMDAAVDAADRERVHRERLEFLSDINDALSRARTRADVARNVLDAAVPRLGDWCSIYLLPHRDALIPEITTAHIDPAMVAYAHELQARYPYDPESPTGIPHVIRSGEAEFYPDITDSVIEAFDVPQDQIDIVRQLALRSAIAVPLTKRGRVLGAMQFVMTSSRRRYTDDDLALAAAVAGRIASSLENLRLAEEQHTIAVTLQASLLPDELPAVPGLETAVRYWATGDGIDVGGDFYDLFAIDDGTTWAVVIGDVCGTGPAAAAVTGLARHTIASSTWNGNGPAQVLEQLNRSMLQRRTGSFCTVAYGVLESGPQGLTFTVACGGHPLPIIVAADGAVTTCGHPGTLIGVLDRITVRPTTRVLHPGDTVVMYTDGVTDVAPPHHLTAEQFAAIVGPAVTGASSAEDVADRIHACLSGILPIEDRRDDIALLVLRVAP